MSVGSSSKKVYSTSTATKWPSRVSPRLWTPRKNCTYVTVTVEPLRSHGWPTSQVMPASAGVVVPPAVLGGCAGAGDGAVAVVGAAAWTVLSTVFSTVTMTVSGSGVSACSEVPPQPPARAAVITATLAVQTSPDHLLCKRVTLPRSEGYTSPKLGAGRRTRACSTPTPLGNVRGPSAPKRRPFGYAAGFTLGIGSPARVTSTRAPRGRVPPLPHGAAAEVLEARESPRAWDAGGRCRPRRRPANSREPALRGRISMPGRHAARGHAIRCHAIVTRTRRSWRA